MKRVTFAVKTILTSVETSIFLDDIYNGEYGLDTNSENDKLIGPVLFKEDESIANYNSLEILTTNYIRYEIKKFFGITIVEFLNLPKYVRELYLDIADKEAIKVTEAMSDISENMDNKLLNTSEGFDFGEE